MAEINLSKYGITGTTEIVYNPSYEMLFEEETKPGLEGYEKGHKYDILFLTSCITEFLTHVYYTYYNIIIERGGILCQ